MQKKLDRFVGAVANPKRPCTALVGGAKVSTIIGVIELLLEKVDVLFLEGGMIFTFYKAQGHGIGSSLVEEDKFGVAIALIEKAKLKGVKLLLPSDVIVADKPAVDVDNKVLPASTISNGWMGLDVGPDSIETFNATLDSANTVVWNWDHG